jgi:membrane-bound ClpP family serine protease
MRELNRWRRFGVVLVLVGTALATSGYIGPGAGAGAIVMLIVVVLAVLLLFAGVFWYPIKRMVRSRRGEASAEEDAGR